MKVLIMAIATGFWSGNLPKAPGTWGSLAALLPWYFLRPLSLPIYLLIVTFLFIIGCAAAGAAEKIMNRQDAGPIVIDEIVGMFITLTLAPDNPVTWVLGFVLFRVFDITKPFPVSWFDTKIHGGIGIMLDDVFAGIYAFIALQSIWNITALLFS